MHYETPRSMEVIAWFLETFGDPQEWGEMIDEPTQLEPGYNWADGRHVPFGWMESIPCIWCTEKAYMLYTLRWL